MFRTHHHQDLLYTSSDWNACRAQMMQTEDFTSYFKKVCEDGKSWKDGDFVDEPQTHHLPVDILYTPEAESCFQNHVDTLKAAHRKAQLKQEFWALLERNVDKPGGTLMDYNQLFEKECFTGLEESDRQQVFDDYQRQLKHRLRIEFQELLCERPSVFYNLNLDTNLTEDDLNVIYNSLNDDQRFRKFYKLEDDRRVMLLNHVVFLDKPSVERCFFHSPSGGCKCTECQVSSILRNQRHLVPNGRSPLHQDSVSSGPLVQPLDLVILGTDKLAAELLSEIRGMCIDNEYKVACRVYNLNYRLIDSDVDDENNALVTPNFKPHGCVCVYNSSESLEYIHSSILKSSQSSEAVCVLIVMLAYEPHNQKELDNLRENGKLLAKSFQCEFIDTPAEDLPEKLKFYPEQIEKAFKTIICGPRQAVQDKVLEDTAPDLRLLICMMCNDPFPMEIPIQPFLIDDSFVVICDPETSSINSEEDAVFSFDAKIDNTKQKVEITVTSYHGGHSLLKKHLYHGYILVYCPKRRASLFSLKSFADAVEAHGGGCLLFLAVPEIGDSKSSIIENSQGLKDGKDLAKSKSASFMQSNSNFKSQGAAQVYSKFLRDVWVQRKELGNICNDDQGIPPPYYDEKNIHRAAAPLPTIMTDPTENHSSSNSQSTEEEPEEPLYDEPNLQQPLAEHQHSNPSPPTQPRSSPPSVEPLVPCRNDNILVKPSMVKSRRDQYAGPAREQYRKSFPVVDSEFCKIRNKMSQSLMEHLDSEAGAMPHYQFRKSRSMKLAVKDEVEAWAINDPKRYQKTSTPKVVNRGSITIELLYDSPANEDDDDEIKWSQNELYDKTSLESGSKTNQKPSLNARCVRPQRPSSAKKGSFHAPLALPEKIEILEDYSTVKNTLVPESDYALVDDALPKSKCIRIKSNKAEQGSDSDESEGSSLEQDKDIYSKVNRKPTPHKKKHKHQNDGQIDTEHNRQSSDTERLIEHTRGRSHSPSQDSTGTGDEPLAGSRVSLRKNMKSPGSNTHLSDSDIVSCSSQQGVAAMNEDDDVLTASTEVLIHKVGSEDNDLDLTESGNWNTWFKKKAGKDSMRTLEKKSKDEERRRQRENEKKQKEQQKLQKKIKKKDNKTAGQSESGPSLSDFPMSPNNPSVPQFIENCVEFIESEGLHAEGIYRIPGNKAQVDLLTAKYTEDANVNISSLEIQVNAVATVLKAVFADLADPLVPVSLYDELIDASERTREYNDQGEQKKKERAIALRKVFLKMHPLNFEVLKFLITHLNKVSQNCDQNSMDCKNLARCWWPTLIRMDWDTFEKMTEFSRIPEEILQTLIEQCTYFFHSGNEILN